MARKRRAPPPPPPPPPAQEESSEEYSSGEEAEADAIRATQKPTQNPKPPSPAANDGSDSSERGDEQREDGEEFSDSDVDADAFQVLQVATSTTKPPPPPASKSESDTDDGEEDHGGSSESEPENPEPIQKKPAKKAKAVAENIPASEPTLSGKAKKAKGEVDESTQFRKVKKAKSGVVNEAPELKPSGKVKKAKAKPEKVVPDSSPPSKSAKPIRWKVEDEIKILEAFVEHVKSHGVYPKTDDLLTAVRDRLDRKNCVYADMYEKVRRLKLRYESAAKRVAITGTLPDNDDELRMYKLSEAIWGENTKEIAAASKSQKNAALSESKKGQPSSNENATVLTGSKSEQDTKEKMAGDSKKKPANVSATTSSPAESRELGNHKEKLDKGMKSRTSKEKTTTAPQYDSTLIGINRGETDKKKIGIDRGETDKKKIDGHAEGVMLKEATTATQNGGILTKSKKGETQEETGTDANVQGIRRGFSELQSLYPNLASHVKSIAAQHPCGETLKRAFESIDDEKASTLESKIKKQRVAEMKILHRENDTKKKVVNILIELPD